MTHPQVWSECDLENIRADLRALSTLQEWTSAGYIEPVIVTDRNGYRMISETTHNLLIAHRDGKHDDGEWSDCPSCTFDHQGRLAEDHLDGHHWGTNPDGLHWGERVAGCPVCAHPSLRRLGCPLCNRYVAIYGSHEAHLRMVERSEIGACSGAVSG